MTPWAFGVPDTNTGLSLHCPYGICIVLHGVCQLSCLFGHREGHKDESITASMQGPHSTEEDTTRGKPLETMIPEDSLST